MTRRLLWSRRALDDLKDQIAFIARDNPKVARLVARKVRAAGDLIASSPIGRSGRVPDTREKSISGLPYVIAYTVVPNRDQETVVILRVIHTSRQWTSGTWPD